MLAGRMRLESVEHSRQWICSGRPNFSLGLFIFSASTEPSGCMGWSCWWRWLASYFLRSFLHDVLITSHGLPYNRFNWRWSTLPWVFLRTGERAWSPPRRRWRAGAEKGSTDEIKLDGAQRLENWGEGRSQSRIKEKEMIAKGDQCNFRVMHSVQCLIWSCQAHWGK